MKIGIDIDETLVDTYSSFKDTIKKYNLKITCEYKDILKSDDFEIIRPYFVEILCKAKLKEGAREVIDYLKDKNCKIYIITARSNDYFDNLESKTLKQLNDYNIRYDEIYFEQNDKSIIGKEISLDLMIDDNIKVYNQMKGANIDCILFDDKSKWIDILKYIERK